MADSRQAQGPGKSVLGIGQRIVTIIVEMVETRLRLAVVELEEEKANLFQLLLMVGLTMLFAAFGLMSLMVPGHLGYRSSVPFERDDRYHGCAVSACANRRHLDFAQSASVHAIAPYAARTG